jgi:hypothetical protein
MEKFNKKLEELKGNNNNPFSVPEGYFEDFPTKIQERIISENKEYAWAIKLFRYIKPQFALGFIIIAFAVIAITTVDFILSNRTNTGIDSDLYTRIIEVDASEFSEQHFIDVLLEDEKKIDDHKQEESDFYIHYLVDENIDYGTLIDEL